MNLSCWNFIWNDFPVSLKSHIDTHRVFLSHHWPIFQLFISFGFRGILDWMTLQLCLTDWDAQATKEKALKGQVTTGERNFSVYGAGSQALRTKVAAVLGCSGQGFLCPRLALQRLWFVAVVALWQTGSQEWAGSWAVTGRWASAILIQPWHKWYRDVLISPIPFSVYSFYSSSFLSLKLILTLQLSSVK